MSEFKKLIFFGILSLLMIGCNSATSSDVRQIVKVLHLIEAKPDSAVVLLALVEDSVIDETQLTDEQFVTICHFKAASLVVKHQTEQAEKWLGKSYSKSFGKTREETCTLYKSLVQLEAVERWGDDGIADSLRYVLVRQLTDVPKSAKETFTLSESELKLINHPFYPIFVFLTFIALLILIWYDRSKRSITNLYNALENNEQQKEQLRNQINHIQAVSREQLGVGHAIYEKVRQGGTMKNISIAEERCFVDYYAFAEPMVFSQLTKPYKNLSLRHTTYLILSEIGYNDAEIQRILFVQPSTIRNYRLRIKRSGC